MFLNYFHYLRVTQSRRVTGDGWGRREELGIPLYTEMEFLDISLTKDLIFCFVLFTVPSTGGFWKLHHLRVTQSRRVNQIILWHFCWVMQTQLCEATIAKIHCFVEAPYKKSWSKKCPELKYKNPEIGKILMYEKSWSMKSGEVW